MAKIPYFSLIVSTLGRVDDLGNLFSSLAAQTCRDFEVVLVDQNGDDRLDDVVARFQNVMPIRRLTCEPGLSRARNLGLRNIAGKVVAFPDDDCSYPEMLLADVANCFEDHPNIDILTGSAQDFDGHPSSARWDPKAGPLARANIWNRAISFTIFLQRHVVDAVGDFNPALGAGSGTPFGSGEETDYLVRALDLEFSGWYDPKVKIIHPHKKFHDVSLKRAYAYGAGMGYVLRKHNFPIRTTLHAFLRPLGGAAVNFTLGQPKIARYYLSTFNGRLYGYCISGITGTKPTAEISRPST